MQSISLQEFLLRSGYRPTNFPDYEKCLASFMRFFPGRTRYTREDVDLYLKERPGFKRKLPAVLKYLSFTMRLADSKPALTGLAVPVESARGKYLTYLRARGCSQSTVRNAALSTSSFIRFADSYGVTLVTDVDRQIIGEYKQRLFTNVCRTGRTLDVSTQRFLLQNVKRFFDFLTREEIIFINHAASLTFPRPEKRLSRNVFSRQEIRKFFDCIDTTTAQGFCDRAMFEIFYGSALRMREVIHLAVDDVRLDERFLDVRLGKGGKDRVVPLTKPACRYLRVYLESVRSRLVDVRSKVLFPTRKGNPLIPDMIRLAVKRYANLAGITRQISSHAFRRSCATHLIEEGADILHVQKLLGHSSANTTLSYIRITTVDLRRALVRYHPREKALAGEDCSFRGIRRAAA